MLRICKFNCRIVKFVLFSNKDKSTFVRFFKPNKQRLIYIILINQKSNGCIVNLANFNLSRKECNFLNLLKVIVMVTVNGGFFECLTRKKISSW